MRPPEARLETYFLRAVRAAGGWTAKLAPTVAGMPDRLVAFPLGRLYLVELKAPGGRLRPVQQVMIDRLARYGVTVHVLTGAEQVDRWVQERTGEQHEAS